MNRRQLPVLILALLALGGALLVAACGGDSTEPEPTIATGTASPRLTLPTSIDGSLTLEPRTAAIGELISIGATGWADDAPISFYLLTEEQADAGIVGTLFDESRILIAEIMPQAEGIVRLEHHIQEEYTGEDGTLLTVAPPQKFYLFALQRGQGRTIGPLTIKEDSE